MITVEEFKDFKRIEHDFDDKLIQMLLDTAKAYVNGAIEVKDSEDVRFNHAVFLLTSHYYDNRGETTEQNLNEIPFGVDALILQLRGL